MAGPGAATRIDAASTDGAWAVDGAAVQSAALAFRRSEGALQVLLVTSRDTGRWVLPKGWPKAREMLHAAAAREALEEAGVRGKIAHTPIGAYGYGKRLAGGAVVDCRVEVFPLAVERQLKSWSEQAQRTQGWFSPAAAAALVEEPDLADLLATFGVDRAR
jgi:8-oxo-dGTP pyrophosphatase MutT (NUDIX family)